MGLCQTIIAASFVLSMLSSIYSHAQRTIISGYIQDRDSKEALIGATVYDVGSKRGATSNSYGFYSITSTSNDTIQLIISYVGYRAEQRQLPPGSNLRLDFFLTSSTTLEEIEVLGTRTNDIVQETQMSAIDVPIRELRNMPMLMGERDLLKAIQLLPGVQQAQEGTTGFFVRGGSMDQNLVQLDEATVYNPSHLFGLLSTFNINAINKVQLIKGGFPANYGGRLSSILEITMKDGNKEKYQTEGGIGLLSSNLTVQGPLVRERSSFIISARRSYIDLIQKAFIPNNTTLYSFYDVNLKLNYSLGTNDRIYLSAFKGRDNGSYTGANSLNYGIGFGNSTATIRWNHLFGHNLFMITSFILNSYNLGVSTAQGNYYSLFYTGISDLNGKTDLSWSPSTDHAVNVGISYFYHTLFPATFSDRIPKSGNRVKLDPGTIARSHANEISFYANHDWTLSARIGLSYGLRIPHFFTPRKSYTLVEPRITTRILLNDVTSFKASFTIMNQVVHAVPYSSASLPTDIWILSSELVKPQTSKQYSAGFFKNLKGGKYEISIEGYYKRMTNQVLFKEGTQLTIESDLEDRLTLGNGKSYGLEFFLRKNNRRLTGWLSYTWAKTTQTFAELNFGKPFPFTYDRRHNLSLVATYNVNKRWSFAADFVFRTGSAFTLPTGRIPVNDGTLYDGWYYDFTTRNNARQNSYHRLDVSFSYKKPRRFFGRKYDSEWVFGVYNLYSRQNPYFVYLTVDAKAQQPKAMQVSLLPAVPSVSYNFKF
jgi:hypothetical protein